MNNPNQYAPQLGQQQQPLATAATYQAEMMEMSSTTYNTTDSQPMYSRYTNSNNNNSTLLSQSLMAAQQMMMSAPSIADEQPTQQYPTIADQQQPQTMPSTTAPTSAVSSLSGGGVSPTYNNNSSMVAAAATSTATTTKRIPLPSMPTSIFLLKNPLLGLGSSSNASDNEEEDVPPTHPVPEFLCHLYTMVNDKSLDRLISWEVPTQDQSKYEGGGMKGVGKVVVHDPMALQDILGRYYRHSSYPSFQRQLNYFGFKKRLTTKKKGKMSPCSFVHESLGKRPSSMLKLKRRQATKRERKTGSATIVSASTSGTSSTTMSTNKLSRKKRSKPLIIIPPRPRTIPATVPLNDSFNTGSVVNLPEATNDTIVEARKMLEQNFLKEFSVVKEHVPLLQPQDQQLYQQQMAAVLPFQEQPQAMVAQQQQLQQQQNEQMLTLLSNHSSAVAMSDNGQLLNHSFTQTNQSKPLWLPTNTLYYPSITANIPQVQGNFKTQATAHTISTNYLMGEVNTTANNMTANSNPVTTTAANTTVESNTVESNNQGGGVINPDLQQELDTLLNNLLSTALPRANELFNDDTLSDDVSCDLIDELQQQQPLQVSDDGGTLSTS